MPELAEAILVGEVGGLLGYSPKSILAYSDTMESPATVKA